FPDPARRSGDRARVLVARRVANRRRRVSGLRRVRTLEPPRHGDRTHRPHRRDRVPHPEPPLLPTFRRRERLGSAPRIVVGRGLLSGRRLYRYIPSNAMRSAVAAPYPRSIRSVPNEFRGLMTPGHLLGAGGRHSCASWNEFGRAAAWTGRHRTAFKRGSSPSPWLGSPLRPSGRSSSSPWLTS